MPDILYPVHMYKDLNRPRYAHDRKAVEALQLDGWTDVRANVPKQEYPLTLYRQDGDTVTIGNYDKHGVIDPAKAEAEKQTYLNCGYGFKAVVKPEEPEAVPLTFNEAVHLTEKQETRIQNLEVGLANAGSDLESLKVGVAELKIISAQLLELATAGKKPSKKADPES